MFDTCMNSRPARCVYCCGRNIKLSRRTSLNIRKFRRNIPRISSFFEVFINRIFAGTDPMNDKMMVNMISGRSAILRHFRGRPIASIMSEFPGVLPDDAFTPVDVCLLDRLDRIYGCEPMELYARISGSRHIYVPCKSKTDAVAFRTESVFSCRSCGSNNCIYTEQQLRSADEPTHKFIQCLDCKTYQVFSN